MPLTQPYSPHTPATMRTSRGQIDVPEYVALAEFEKLDWDERDHWELIEGVPCMAPAGVPEHQDILGVVFVYLVSKLQRRGYKVLVDVDVRFARQQSYLRPDISVFPPGCHPEPKATPVRELPDLVVEFLSPSTASIDLGPKKAIYGRAGVKEYWVADPATGALLIYTRAKGGDFEQLSADEKGHVPSPLIGASLRIKREGGSFRVIEA